MADFLSRLAGRTLGVAPIVQPVIAPRFAPSPAHPDSPPTIEEFEDVIDATESTPRRVPSRSAALPAGRLGPSALVTDIDRDREEGAASAPRETSVGAAARTSDEPRARSDAPEIAVHRLVKAPADQPSWPTQQEDPAAELSARPQADPRIEPIGWRLPRRAVDRYAVVPPITRGAPAAVAAESPAAAPVIRVTIGRIDVRALPAPARPVPSPAAPRPPTPSLDGYLRSRNQGRR